ncbi:MAG TPA: SDR family oxidoreductase [Gemmatimonadales bacterium]|jgi:NAD(P)-dependent dehydrogenase (short-subunit alcohol dehydrogenase family)|nr:SDR family oxidoreductase [Gemmatimonadales bacterium]
MAVVFVTGASRGIGHEVVRQCADRGDQVVASARSNRSVEALGREFGDNVLPLRCDVTDDSSIAEARRQLDGRIERIDLLMNSAGLYSLHADHWDPSLTTFDTISRAELNTVFDVNASGAMLVIKAMLGLLRRSDRPRILNLTSLMGSVSARTSPGDYAYAASKAALNIMTRSFAAEFRAEGIIAVAITPGWVRTDMGGTAAALAPEESVRTLLTTADRLTMQQSGTFLDYQGVTQPW